MVEDGLKIIENGWGWFEDNWEWLRMVEENWEWFRMVKDGLGGFKFTLSLSERESHSQDRSDQGPFHSPRPQGFRNLKYQH